MMKGCLENEASLITIRRKKSKKLCHTGRCAIIILNIYMEDWLNGYPDKACNNADGEILPVAVLNRCLLS